MKTKYIGIESICINLQELRVTIACNIMLEGSLYNEAVYTNIFCHYVHLRLFLKLDKSPFSEKIIKDIEAQMLRTDTEFIQINLPEYVDNKIEWKFPTMVNLEIAKDDKIPFQCYYFDIEDIRLTKEIQSLLDNK